MPFNSPITPSFQFSITAAIDIALVDAGVTGAGATASLLGAADFASATAGAGSGRTAGALGSWATRPPKTARPVAGFTGAGAICGRFSSSFSSLSTRANNDSIPICNSRCTRRTKATSSTTRESGALRMSLIARPNVSMTLTMRGVPSRLACAATSAARSSGNCTSSGAICVKNASRMCRTKSFTMVRGSRPKLTVCATAANKRPASYSMSASTNSSRGVTSSTMPPVAAASSSADKVSRAEPPP